MKIHARILRLSPRRWPLLLAILLLTSLLGSHQSQLSAQEIEKVDMTGWTTTMRSLYADQEPAQRLAPLSAVPCVAGFAGTYPCDNVDLLAFMPLSTFAATGGNDNWGWTDPLTGKEYALMGLNNGTAFVDISDPVNPLYLGKLPTHTSSSTWRDIKVYNNYVFIVSEASAHGMQVFDLTELRNVPVPPVTFSETAHFSGFGSAHNVVINEDSGYAYGVGASTCAGGLHMVNIQNPTNPVDAGCFSADGYTHDAQCVNYTGPDPDHQGQEICFNSNEDTVTIVNVTNKANPQQISRTGYAGSAYTHQGWLTEDQHYFIFDDELDESYFGHNTRTRVLDVTNLDQPVLVGYTDSPAGAIDHNQYTHNGFGYQANYRAGLRIVDLADVANANLPEIGYFDIYPANNNANFNGAWNVFPYFDSGVVIISGIEQGLFIVQPHLPNPDYAASLSDSTLDGTPGSSVVHTLELSNLGAQNDSYTLAVDKNLWPTSLLTSSPVSVPAGSSVTIQVQVDIPAGAILNQNDDFTLSATSQGSPGLTASGQGHTNVSGTAGINTSGNSSGSGLLGQVVTHTITVTNTGSVNDTFTLSLGSFTWPTSLATTTTGLLAPGASTTFAVYVTVGSGPSDSVALHLTSTFDPNLSSTLNVLTLSDGPGMYYVYLPVNSKP